MRASTIFSFALSAAFCPAIGAEISQTDLEQALARQEQMFSEQMKVLRAEFDRKLAAATINNEAAGASSKAEPSQQPAAAPDPSTHTTSWAHINDPSLVVVEEPKGEVRALSEKGDSGPAGLVTPDRSGGAPRSRIHVDASSGNTDATIELKLGTANWLSNRNRTVEDTASVTFTAPIDNKNGKSASFATLSGLSSGFQASAAWTRSTAPALVETEKLSSLCRDLGLNLLDVDDKSQTCQTNLITVLASKDSVLNQRLLDILKPYRGWGHIFSLSVGGGHDDFSYFNALDDKRSASRYGWSISGSAGMTSPDHKLYVGGGIDFERSYKSSKERIVCPQSSDPTFECTQGSFAPPDRTIQRVAYGELRSELLRPFSVRIEHDFASHDNAIDVPIYLLTDLESQFTGGVRIGWTTDDHFIGGVFVGRSFELTPH